MPGSTTDLLSVKAAGGDVRIVYSPLDAVKLAEQNPAKEIVFFAVGFETTAPATAMAVYQAAQKGLKNFSLLVSHVLVPPAMEAILERPGPPRAGLPRRRPRLRRHGLRGIHPHRRQVSRADCRDRLRAARHPARRADVHPAIGERAGPRSKTNTAAPCASEGNRPAQQLIREVFQVTPRKWRGIGEIPQSGLGLRDAYAAFDAERKFGVAGLRVEEPTECLSGLVLQGKIKPHECPAFGTRCTPEHPLGATMVSSEGACAAYYRYRREPATRAA